MATVHLGNAARSDGESSELDILVSPRSGSSRIEGFDQWRQRVAVKVRAPPADGKANREIEELFRSLTGAEAEIVRGAGGRTKTVRIAMPLHELTETMERL